MAGYFDRDPNEAVSLEEVKRLSEILGRPLQDVASRYGYSTGRDKSLLGSALSAGTDDLQGLGYSAGGALADIASRAGLPGAGTARDWLNKQAETNRIESAVNGRPEYDDVMDQSLGSLPAWALYQGAKQIPNLAAVIGAGVVAPQAVVPSFLARAGAVAPRAIGGAGLEAGASMAARRAALEGGTAWGKELVGGMGVGSAMGLGSMYQESVEAGDPSPFAALAASPLYGLTETAPAALLKNTLRGAGGAFSGALPTRMAKAGAVNAAGGATSEGLQNEMEMLFNPNISDEEKFSRRVNAIAAGGVAEGGIGSLAGFRKQALSGTDPTDLLRRDDAEAPPQRSTAIPLVDTLNQQFGLDAESRREQRQDRKGYASQFAAAFDEPSGVMVTDSKTGQQRELSVGEYQQLQSGVLGTADAPSQGVDGIASNASTNIANAVATREQQEQLAASRQSVIERFGEPTPWTNNKGGEGFTFAGNNYASQEKLDEALDKFSAKSETRQQLEGAIREGMSRLNPKSGLSLKQLEELGNQWLGTREFATIDDVVVALDERIAREQASPNVNDKFLKKLTATRAVLTGEQIPNVPAPGPQGSTAAPGTRNRISNKQQTPEDKKAAANTGEVITISPEDYAAQQQSQLGVQGELPGSVDVPPAAVPVDPVANEMATDNPFVAEVEQAQEQTEGTEDDATRRQKILEGAFGPAGGNIFGLLLMGNAGNPVDIARAINAEMDENNQVTVGDVTKAVAKLKTEDGRAGFKEELAYAAEQLGYTPEQMEVAFSGKEGTRRTDGSFEQRRSFLSDVYGENLPILEMTREGKTQSEIAAATGLDQRRVSDRLFEIELATGNTDQLIAERLEAEKEAAQRAKIEMSATRLAKREQTLRKRAEAVKKSIADATAAAKKKYGLNDEQVQGLLRPPESSRATSELRAEDFQGQALPAEEDAGESFDYRPDADMSASSSGVQFLDENQVGGGKANVDSRATQARLEKKLQTASAMLAEAEAQRAKLKKDKQPVPAALDAQIGIYTNEVRRIYGDINKAISSAEAIEAAQEAEESRLAEAEEKDRNAGRKTTRERSEEGLFDNAEDVDLDSDTEAELRAERKSKETQERLESNKQAEADKVGATLTGANEPPKSKSTAVAVVDGAPKPKRVTKKKAAAPAAAVESKPDPLRDVTGETTRDRAERVWTEQRRDGYPEWATLSPQAQNAVVTVVKEGPKRGDQDDIDAVATQVAKGQLGPIRTGTTTLSRVEPQEQEQEQKVAPQSFSSAGQNPTTGQPVETVTLDDLASRSQGVANLRTSYATFGLDSLFNFVKEWTLGDAGGNNGEMTPSPGGATLELNRALFSSNEVVFSEWVASHEVGHAIDLDGNGNALYSLAPDMGLAINPRTKQIIPVGAVAREMHGLYKSDSRWASMLEYPFDLGVHTGMDQFVVRAELFAQTWAAYTNPKTRDMLRQEAPATFAFMERVAAHATQRATKRGRVQAQTNQAASQNGGAQVVQTGQPAGTGRVFPSKGTAQTVAGFTDRLSPGARQKSVSALDFVKKFGFSAMMTEDLADMARGMLGSVDNYVKAARMIAVERRHALQEIDRVSEMYDKLPQRERGVGDGSVNKLIHDMTISRKWAYDPSIKGANLDAALAARFKALSPAGQAVVKATFKHGQDMLAKKRAAIIEAIDKDKRFQLAEATGDTERAKIERKHASTVERFNKLLNIPTNLPYAPLKRFGDYVMVAKSKDYIAAEEKFKTTGDRKELTKLESDERHYVVSFYETLGEADSAERSLTGNYAYKDAFQKDAGLDVLYGSTDLFLAFGRMRNMLRVQLGDEKSADNDGLNKAIKLLGDLYLSSVADASARKSELERRRVAGADLDMMRAFVTQGRADAHFLASLRHNDDVLESLTDMRREAKNSPQKRDAIRYANEFTLRHAQSMNYTPNRLIDGLKRTTSIWMLATSPAYYFQQLVQPFVLSLPVMGGQFGYARSAKALTDAYGKLRPLLATAKISGEMDFSSLPKQQRQIIQAMIDMGRLDLGMEEELGRFDTKNSALNRGDAFLRGANNRVEQINRAATALAAAEMYLSKPANRGDMEGAINYASRIIHQTHGSYDGFNSPRIMGGVSSIGGLLLQFKKFQIIQLSLLARLFNESFRGATADDRLVARKQVGYVLGTAFALGGALGLPGATLMMTLAGAIFGDDDEPDDAEAAMRRAIGDKGLADLLLKGVPAAAGVDISGKVGMGNVLSLLPYTDVDLASRKGMGETLLALGGPFIGGLMPKAADGVGLMLKGDYVQGAEKILPNGLGNALKGMREGLDTGVVTRRGDLLVKPEDINAVEMAFQMLGLPSTQVTDRLRVQAELRNATDFYRGKADEIKQAYVKAQRSGDSAGMAEARQDWQSIQASRQRNGFTPQPISVLMKAPQQTAERERNVIDGVQTNKSNRKFVEEATQ